MAKLKGIATFGAKVNLGGEHDVMVMFTDKDANDGENGVVRIVGPGVTLRSALSLLATLPHMKVADGRAVAQAVLESDTDTATQPALPGVPDAQPTAAPAAQSEKPKDTPAPPAIKAAQSEKPKGPPARVLKSPTLGVLLDYVLSGDGAPAQDNYDAVLAAVEGLRRSHPTIPFFATNDTEATAAAVYELMVSSGYIPDTAAEQTADTDTQAPSAEGEDQGDFPPDSVATAADFDAAVAAALGHGIDDTDAMVEKFLRWGDYSPALADVVAEGELATKAAIFGALVRSEVYPMEDVPADVLALWAEQEAANAPSSGDPIADIADKAVDLKAAVVALVNGGHANAKDDALDRVITQAADRGVAWKFPMASLITRIRVSLQQARGAKLIP